MVQAANIFPLEKTRTCLVYIVNGKDDDGLVIQGARASADTVLILAQNIPILTLEGITHCRLKGETIISNLMILIYIYMYIDL